MAGVDGEKRASAIDFWFDFGSNYSYLSAMRIEAEAARMGVNVRWRPFLLGWETSPFVLQKEKGAYVWKDMVRQCQKYGLPWTRPSVFPRTALLPLRVALVGADQPWVGNYCRRIMAANFVDDCEIDSVDVVEPTLVELGLPSTELLMEARSEAIKLRLRHQTETAKALGIFGAPTFFVEGEMFWGNDRLDDALAMAAWGQA
jgi:2-hydroxychromene-2-carboxylate isomerase